MQNKFAITFEDVIAAAQRIQNDVIRTPVISPPQINDSLGAEVFFKCENLQHVGAFKARGACNAVASLNPNEVNAGVVTHSSGNHAAALARAAGLRGIPAHIVMPHNSAAVKIEAVRRLGVEPVWSEPTAESRQQTADQVIAETGATFIHPYNNPQVMAGQGTAALEFMEQVPNLDALIVPVGGGGLLSGSLIVTQHLFPDLPVLAAEPAWADDAWRSLKSSRIEMPTRYDTIADGLRTPLGTLTFPIIRSYLAEVLLVDEDQIRDATTEMLLHGRLLAEPSGAVPFAALRANRKRFEGKRIGIIISGGNTDTEVLRDLL